MERFLDIIIPEYDCKEEFMKRLLQSISRQINVDFNEIGIIIVNDKSKNKLRKGLFKNFPKLNIEYFIKDVNEGVGMTRQYGLDRSTAQYVTFVDQDDELYGNDSLFQVISHLKNTSIDFLVTEYIEEFVDSNNVLRANLHETLDGKEVLHGVFIKRSFLDNNGIKFIPGIRYHDDSYIRRVCIFLAPVNFLSVITYNWKANQESIVRRKRKNDYLVDTFEDYYLAIVNACKFAKEKKIPQAEYIFNSLMGLFIILNSTAFSYENLRELKSKYEKMLFDAVVNYNYEIELYMPKYDILYESLFKLVQREAASDETFSQFIQRLNKDYGNNAYKKIEIENKLDIIIPYYSSVDASSMIRRLLTSVKNQMWVNKAEIGIIFVSDNSPVDIDKAVLDEFPLFNIKYYKKDLNEGQGMARQYGLEKSTAKYVTFVDQDDILYGPFAIYQVINNFDNSDVEMLYTDYFRYNPATGDRRIMTYNDLQCLHGAFFRRKSLIDGKYAFNNKIRMYEDTYFMLITSRTLEPKYLSIPTYVWYVNPNSQSALGNVGGQMIQKRIDEFLIANIEAVDFIDKKGFDVKDLSKEMFYYLLILIESDLFKDVDIEKYEKSLYEFYNKYIDGCCFDDYKDAEIINSSIAQLNKDYGISKMNMKPCDFLSKVKG